MTAQPARPGAARVAIDCDPGRDDALAILAALGSPEIHVDLITTVAGNVTAERGAANALGVLAVAGVDDVPVYLGATQPLARPLVPGSTLHGDMGASDPPLPATRGEIAGPAGPALRAWCREPTDERKLLVAIGPLTNIAALLVNDPAALDALDTLYVMGGSIGQIPTRVSPTAEFNFHTDPEAADIVIRSGVPIRLFDYDATTACQIPVEAIPEIAAGIGGRLGRYVAGWLQHLWEYANRAYGRPGIAIHDLYAVAGAVGVEPGCWDWRRISVDTGDLRRGTLDSVPAEPGEGIAVARDIDPKAMAALLRDSAARLPGARVEGGA